MEDLIPFTVCLELLDFRSENIGREVRLWILFEEVFLPICLGAFRSLLYDNSKSSIVKERNERAKAQERLDGMNG
ncbi:hypothetical protein Tco_1574938 [Tanacetum coccineum]